MQILVCDTFIPVHVIGDAAKCRYVYDDIHMYVSYRKLKPVQRLSIRGEVIFGRRPVLLALRQGRRTFHKLYVKDTLNKTQDSESRPDAILQEMLVHAAELEVPVEYVPKQVLDRLSWYHEQALRQHQVTIEIYFPY